MPLAIQPKSNNRIWALVIGGGLALSPIHNQWLTNLVTQNGEVGFFLPAFGTAIWLMGSLAFVINNWEQLDWGNKKVLVALSIIVAAMGLSGFANGLRLQDKLAPLFMGLSLFAVYLVARRLGKEIFYALIPFVVLGVIVSIINGILHPGQYSGGLITNYCASAGFLIFGAIVNQGKWHWLLLSLSLIGLFFIGALEAVFIVSVMGIVIISRRDFSRQFIIVASIVMFVVGIWAGLGYLLPLYEGNHNLSILFDLLFGRTKITHESITALTSGRWHIIIAAVQNIRLFGQGYSLSTVGGGIVHNIPLIIVHQIGLPAAIAWVFVTIYCLIKTKWKYAWIAVMAMSVWDHYLWTQFAPWWWALVGVSSTSAITSDKIFKTK